MSVIEGKNYTKNTPKKWVFLNFMLQKKISCKGRSTILKKCSI